MNVYGACGLEFIWPYATITPTFKISTMQFNFNWCSKWLPFDTIFNASIMKIYAKIYLSKWIFFVLFQFLHPLSDFSILITQSIDFKTKSNMFSKMVHFQDWKHPDWNGMGDFYYNSSTETISYFSNIEEIHCLESWESTFRIWKEKTYQIKSNKKLYFFCKNNFIWNLKCSLHFEDYLLYHEIEVLSVEATIWSL